MSDYDFKTLSDLDFERITTDLLSEELQLRFQRFPKGTDGGIDALHGCYICSSTVIQCKQYANSKFPNLLSDLKKKERLKIERLSPKKYILATALPLTLKNKEAIVKAIDLPFLSVDGIFGKDDLNALIRKYPEIEKAHYKLWLTSSAVLHRIVHQGKAIWNSLTTEDITRRMSRYVQTAAHPVARDLLSKHGFCILSGIPGIGKTTLAEALIAEYLESGYELIAIQHDANEAMDSIEHSKKQIVYYDDFLGQSSVSEKLNKNEDRCILRLCEQANSSASKLRVVMTTREYILEDAKLKYERIAKSNLDIAKFVVDLGEYSRRDRAEILYNHIYFSKLSSEHASEFVGSRKYLSIIDHANYSPRIIEWMVVGKGSKEVAAAQFSRRFEEVLDNPEEIWKHAFEQQISDDARAILLVLASLQGPAALSEIQFVWAGLTGRTDEQALQPSIRRAYKDAVRQLDGSFIKTMREGDDLVADFHNPSVKDYTRRVVAADVGLQRELMRTCRGYEQLHCLLFMNSQGRISGQINSEVAQMDILADGLRRVMYARPLLYRLVQNMIGGNASSFYVRNTRSIANRLADVANWYSKGAPRSVLDVCMEILTDLESAGEFERISLMRLCDFARIAYGAYPKESSEAALVSRVVREIASEAESCNDLESLLEWREFVQDHRHLFDDDIDDAIQDAADLALSDVVEGLMLDMDIDSDDLEYRWGEACERAEQLGVRRHSYVYSKVESEIKQRISDLRDAEAMHHDEPVPKVITWEEPAKTECSDEEIHRMFDALQEWKPD